MKSPNFFIVGAPRCGTTSMYTHLKSHPEVFMPDLKEPHFFAKDLYAGKWPSVRDELEYMRLFMGAGSAKAVGEASVWYLYSKAASLEIKRLLPEALIVIMLRNPVELIYSLHSRHVYAGYEYITDFESALEAEEYRRQGIPLGCNPGVSPGLNAYRDVGCLYEQVRRFLQAFARDKVHVIIYDDFRADTGSSFKETLRFLGLDDRFTPELATVNANMTVRSRRLQQLLDDPPPVASRLAVVLIPSRLHRRLEAELRKQTPGMRSGLF